MSTFNLVELEALEDFYVAGNGDDWYWKTDYTLSGIPWNFSQPHPNPCLQRWQGIKCNSDCSSSTSCTVESLILPQYYIFGTIPLSIGNLTSLRVFNVRQNVFSSSLPATIINMKNLTVFDVGVNGFQGQFPSIYSSLTKLLYLDLSNNRFTGNCLDLITTHFIHLEFLDISYSKFTGVIPERLGDLQELMYLGLSSTNLHGTIPDSIGTLAKLFYFNIATNYFLTGTIPFSLGNLLQLQYLKIFSTSLTGTFPMSFRNFTLLTYINLGYNFNMDNSVGIADSRMITNSKTLIDVELANVRLPDDFLLSISTELPHLQRLYLAHTGLTGTIPENFSQLIHLHDADLSNNALTGTIPSIFKNFVDLAYVNLSYNLFSQTIPSYLFSLPKLRDIDISANMLVGQIPQALDSTQLATVYIQFNALTSTIPTTITGMKKLGNCFIAHNLLTGTIPNGLLSMTTLISLYLENNLLTGMISVIPNPKQNTIYRINISTNFLHGNLSHTNIGSARQLGILDLSKNLFSNTLYNVFTTTAIHLQYIILRQNFFEGSLDFLTQSSFFHQVVVLDISDNQLTGALSDNITQSFRQMNIFAAVKNCITGTIPSSLCAQHNLITVALDGLTSASNCQSLFFASWTKVSSYQLRESHGKLPECLFTMPILQTLHLSGNGLEGTIPNNISSRLIDLSLSYNQLTGTIPSALQQRLGNSSNPSFSQPLLKLDLAFNKITGSLLDPGYYFQSDDILSAQMSNITSTSTEFYDTLSLEINRLSGNIPNGYLDISNINLLRGNIFDCSNGGRIFSNNPSSLPNADEYHAAYDCGSNGVNLSLMIWFLLTVSLLMPILIIFGIVRLYNRTSSAASSRKNDSSMIVDESHTVEIDKKVQEKEVVSSSSEVSDITNYFLVCLQNYGGWFDQFFQQCKEDYLIYSMPLTAQELLAVTTTTTPLGTPTIDRFLFIEFGFCFQLVRRIVAIIAIGICILLLPIYSALNIYYSTYQYTYTWMISLGYLGGIVPSYLLLLVFLLLIILCMHWIQQWVVNTRQTEPNNGITSRKSRVDFEDDDQEISGKMDKISWNYWAKVGIICWWNVIIVVGVNIAYVYMINTMKLSNINKFFVSIALSVFKIVWGHVMVLQIFVKYLDWKEDLFRSIYQLCYASDENSTYTVGNTQTEETINRGKMAMKTRLLTILFLFNNILAPILADTLINSNCFYYLFIQAPVVSVSYSACNSYSIAEGTLRSLCNSQASLSSAYVGVYDGTTSYTPPFVYNYQCSSSILSDFVTIFIYRYAISGLLVPVIHWMSYGYFVYKTRIATKGFGKTSKSVVSLVTSSIYRTILNVFLPKPFRLIINHNDYRNYKDSYCPENATEIVDQQEILNTLHRNIENKNVENALEIIEEKAIEAKEDSISPQQLVLFDKLSFLVKLINDCAVMLTFGVAFPPLAIIIALSIILNTFHWQLILGKFVQFSRLNKILYLPLDGNDTSKFSSYSPCSNPKILFILSKNFAHLLRLFWKKVSVLILVPSWFLACFLLDILGDDVGIVNALWIFIVMGMLPTLYWIALLQLFPRMRLSLKELMRKSPFHNNSKTINNELAAERTVSVQELPSHEQSQS